MLADSPPQALYQVPRASNPWPDPRQKLCMEWCMERSLGKELMNDPEGHQCRRSQRCPGTCQEVPQSISSLCGHCWVCGWLLSPWAALLQAVQLCCHSHRLLQAALLLQSNEGKHECSESSPGIRLQSANSFSPGTIFKLQSICLRKVPSAAYKYANSPFEEPQLRTPRSSPGLPPLSRSSISLHNHPEHVQVNST